MTTLYNYRKSLIALLATCMIAFSATAGDGEKTATIKMSKTIDGKTTEKTEVIKIKDDEEIDEAVKKLEKDFLKDEKESGKKVEFKIDVKVTDKDGKEIKPERKAGSDNGRKVKTVETTTTTEDGKEIKKEKRITIE